MTHADADATTAADADADETTEADADETTEADEEVHLIWLIAEAYAYTRKEVDQVSRPYRVTPVQLGVLDRLAEEPGLSGAEVARRIFISPQAAHLALATLERKGLIERRTEPPNGRSVRSVLTAKGEAVVAACRADVVRIGRRLAAPLDHDERREFVDFLRRYLGRGAPPRD